MRVREDVAAGRLSMARHRLRGLIDSYLSALICESSWPSYIDATTFSAKQGVGLSSVSL